MAVAAENMTIPESLAALGKAVWPQTRSCLLCLPKKGSRGVWRECPTPLADQFSIIAAEWEEMKQECLLKRLGLVADATDKSEQGVI